MEDEMDMAESPQVDISGEGFRGGMELPPELEEPYKVAVEAGLRMLFSEDTVESTIDFVQGEGSAPEKIADGITGIVMTMFEGSNQTMPPQILIPVGVELIGHCAEWARQSGLVELSDADVAEGMSLFVQRMLEAAGADPAQIQEFLNAPDSGVGLPEGVDPPVGEAPPVAEVPGDEQQGAF